MSRPATGNIWWRLKGSPEWKFGYVTEGTDYSCVRIGAHAGQIGPMYDVSGIEWKKYTEHLAR